MPEEVQQVAISVALEAMAKFDVEKDVRHSYDLYDQSG